MGGDILDKGTVIQTLSCLNITSNLFEMEDGYHGNQLISVGTVTSDSRKAVWDFIGNF